MLVSRASPLNARWDNSTKKWSRSYDESLAELHWSTTEQRHSYLSLCQVYEIVNRLDCINFTDYFSPCKAPQTRYCKVNSLQCMPSRVNAFRVHAFSCKCFSITHLLFGIYCNAYWMQWIATFRGSVNVGLLKRTKSRLECEWQGTLESWPFGILGPAHFRTS